MRTLGWALVVALVVTSTGARAEAPAQRGGLSVAGLTFTLLGVGGLGLGLGGLLSSISLRDAQQAYEPLVQPVPPAVGAIVERYDASLTLAVVGLSAGAALLVTGVVCLLVDSPRAPAVAVVPVRDGAMLTFALRL